MSIIVNFEFNSSLSSAYPGKTFFPILLGVSMTIKTPHVAHHTSLKPKILPLA